MTRYATLEETLAQFDGPEPAVMTQEKVVPKLTAWGEPIAGEEYRLLSFAAGGVRVFAWLAFAGEDWDYVREADAFAYGLMTWPEEVE